VFTFLVRVFDIPYYNDSVTQAAISSVAWNWYKWLSTYRNEIVAGDSCRVRLAIWTPVSLESRRLALFRDKLNRRYCQKTAPFTVCTSKRSGQHTIAVKSVDRLSLGDGARGQAKPSRKGRWRHANRRKRAETTRGRASAEERSVGMERGCARNSC